MRIIVTALSDELKQLVQYVVDYEPGIEVIREEPNPDRLPEAVAESKPDWIFLLQSELDRNYELLRTLFSIHPALQVLLITEDGKHRRIQLDENGRQVEDDWDEFTTSEFIYLLHRGEYPEQRGESGPNQ